MSFFHRTPSIGSLRAPSFTSTVSLPPSYQSDSHSTHSSAQRGSQGTLSPDTISDISFDSEATHPGPRYVYYRVYSPTDGIKVKNPEFPEDPYMGRTLAIRIPPPHLVSSVKRHLCGREGLQGTDHMFAVLFNDISCLTPLDDSEPVQILDRAGIGSTIEDPVVLVMLEPILDRPVTESAIVDRAPAMLERGRAGILYKLKANYDSNVSLSGWLSFKGGDILHTDGIPIKGPGAGTCDGFHARNNATQTSGFVRLTYGARVTYLEFVGPSPNLPRNFRS